MWRITHSNETQLIVMTKHETKSSTETRQSQNGTKSWLIVAIVLTWDTVAPHKTLQTTPMLRKFPSFCCDFQAELYTFLNVYF